jgi:hypothetical protein
VKTETTRQMMDNAAGGNSLANGLRIVGVPHNDGMQEATAEAFEVLEHRGNLGLGGRHHAYRVQTFLLSGFHTSPTIVGIVEPERERETWMDGYLLRTSLAPYPRRKEFLLCRD